MWIRNALNRALIQRTVRKSKSWTSSIEKAQTSVFRAWIQEISKTRQGSNHWLKPEGGKSLFQKNVFPHTWEDTRAFLEEYKEDEASPIWPKPPIAWIPSLNTPGFQFPLTESGLQSLAKALLDAYHIFLHHKNPVGPKASITFIWPEEVPEIQGGLGRLVHPYYRGQFSFSTQKSPKSPEVLIGRPRDLLNLNQAYEEVKLLVLIGQGRTALKPALKNKFKNAEVHSLSWEAFQILSFQSLDRPEYHVFFANHGAYFEAQDLHSKEIKELSNISPNQTFMVLVSNNNGLIRFQSNEYYQSGEEMGRFKSLGSLLFEGNQVFLFQEELETALKNWQEEDDQILLDYTLHPKSKGLKISVKTKGGTSLSPQALDSHLCKTCFSYSEARKSGSLTALELEKS